MSIRRGPSAADNFARIHNAALRDKRLSWRARGLLGYLMSHAEGWRTSVARLVQEAPEGRDAVRAAIAELTEHGYLERAKQSHGERGKFGEVDYIVTDQPSSGLPTTVQPTSANPHPKKNKGKKTNTEEDDQQPPRGRATEKQVGFLMDIHVAAGGIRSAEVEATFREYSITQADAEIRAGRKHVRRST